MTKRVLLTGASGYLGGHVLAQLRERGDEVFALDSHWRTFPERRPVPSPGLLTEFLQQADAVIHLAWYSTAGDGQPALQQHCLEDTVGLAKLVKYFAHPGPLTRRTAEGSPLPGQPSCRFIFASSVSVYGHREEGYPTETDRPTPNCAYTRAKLAAEYALEEALPGRVLTYRFGSMMGLGAPGHRTKTELVVNAFATAGAQGLDLEVWNPEDDKPLIHVADAAWLLCTAVHRPTWLGTYNATISTYKAQQIAEYVSAWYRVKHHTSTREGPRRSCNPHSGKLFTLLVDDPDPSVRDHSWRGLSSTVKELKDYRPTPADRNEPWLEPELPTTSANGDGGWA